MSRPVIWTSGALLGGAIAWNGIRGDWIDGLFLLGLGIGGALLLTARGRDGEEEAVASVLRWSGLFLLGCIVVFQILLLVRYLFSVL